MAETITRQLREPFVEAAGLGITNKGLGLLGKSIPTSTYTGRQFVQGQSGLEQQAATAAAGLGSLTGAQGYQQFQSPYQQQVIDASLAEFDRNAAVQQTGLRDQAIQAGAYGGGREGVMQAQYMNQGALNRAQLQASMLNDGFMQAQQAAGTDLAARQGLGQYQQALGQADQGFEQAKLDAGTLAAREAEFEPFTRLGLVGQQLAQIQPGAFPSTTIGYQQSAAPASPMASFLGGAAGAGGVLGKLGIFG